MALWVLKRYPLRTSLTALYHLCYGGMYEFEAEETYGSSYCRRSVFLPPGREEYLQDRQENEHGWVVDYIRIPARLSKRVNKVGLRNFND